MSGEILFAEQDSLSEITQFKSVAVVFNGPPGSGKDTAAKHVVEHCKARHLQFKDQLIKMVIKAYRVSREWFDAHYTRELKNIPTPELCGFSPREALINMSENIIKPVFGKAVFGKISAKKIKDGQCVVFSDSGFQEELSPIVEKLGCDMVLVIKLARDGCDFNGDSRNYLPDRPYGCPTYHIDNNGTIEDLGFKVRTAIDDFGEMLNV